MEERTETIIFLAKRLKKDPIEYAKDVAWRTKALKYLEEDIEDRANAFIERITKAVND